MSSVPANDIDLSQIEFLLDPVKWAKEVLKWEARDYQIPLLRASTYGKRIVIRAGRRLGKSECLSIICLWHAFTQINKRIGSDQYDILIVCPHESQVRQLFDRMNEHINRSEILQASIARNVKMCIEFKNGSKIAGMTAATRSNTGAMSIRGQRADVLILDEADYLHEDDITNIINLRNEDPGRIKIIAASTPSGRRSYFWRWCSGAPDNGWLEFHIPSTVNKDLLQIDPETGMTYLDEIKADLTEISYLHEVLAEFGEEEQGVFQKRFIDAAVELGKKLNVRYTDHPFERKPGLRVLAVDWDKYGASTNMLAVEYDATRDLIVPFLRVEIPRTEWTYNTGVQKIIELNSLFDFDSIMVDAGAGEKQIEDLHLYGLQHPETGLADKVKRVNFAEKVQVIDPFTKKPDKKPIKPFMVECATLALEHGRVALNPEDRRFIRQLESYRVKSIGLNGVPVFNDEEEHIVDVFCMCIYAIVKATDPLLLRKKTNVIVPIPSYATKRTVRAKPIYSNGRSTVAALTYGATGYRRGFSTLSRGMRLEENL